MTLELKNFGPNPALVDENVLPLVVDIIKPEFILALNLFRDQLDRYGEVDNISQRWQQAILRSQRCANAHLNPDTIIILNGDDPTLAYLGKNLTQQQLEFEKDENRNRNNNNN